MSTESVMPANQLIFCCPLLLLPSIFPIIKVFFNESVLHIKRPKYWSFSFSISPSSEYSGLIFFRIDWVDLAVQRTLKSVLQHHSSEASVPRCSVFYGPALTSVPDALHVYSDWVVFRCACVCFTRAPGHLAAAVSRLL